jgi:penicillin amidase
VQRAAEQTLASWDGQVTATSPGASIWWLFWSSYLTTVFQPWWSAAGVPVSLDPFGLSVGASQPSLDADLAGWTADDQQNAAFTPPQRRLAAARQAARRNGALTPAAADMQTAFRLAVNQLSEWMGGNPAGWQFGKLHTAQFPSLTDASALGYGPVPAGGDDSTANAAVGWLNSQFGPSARVIAGWPATGQAIAEVSYPGGQSENPASPWYDDQTAAWWAGSYLPMPWAGGTSAPITWELQP